MNPFPHPLAYAAPHAQMPFPLPFLPPNASPSSAFWSTEHVFERVKSLNDTLRRAEAMKKELEILIMLNIEENDLHSTRDRSCAEVSSCLDDKGIDIQTQGMVSINAANTLIWDLKSQLEPFRQAMDDDVPWEEKSCAVRFFEKQLKSKRNKRWRKRKKMRLAAEREKELERFVKADQEADEWRSREIVKDAARKKVEKMKEIAKSKAKEERKRLESELELVMIVEKLRELRSIRIDRLKKQGHFLPDEDDRFLDKVRAAVEEEERQKIVETVADPDADAAKNLVTNSDYESPKLHHTNESIANESEHSIEGNGQSEIDILTNRICHSTEKDSTGGGANMINENSSQTSANDGANEKLTSLPIEFIQYYHGSNNDMGTLIEVRRTWDAYLRPGGSRIPGHWVQPPPPSSDVWASYLVKPSLTTNVESYVISQKRYRE